MDAPEWLVVIDLQRAFSDQASPWRLPGFDDAAARIRELVPAFGDRVIFTRFVPPRLVEGSWQAYYRRWAFAVRDQAAALWEVIEPWRDAPSVASHTFSKGSVGKDLLGGSRRVVLFGGSTGCCV